MAIKIKRATEEGLKECEGIFFEVHKRQFCLVEDDDWYYAIELSTGCSAAKFDPDFMSKTKALSKAKKVISKISEMDWDLVLNRVREVYCKKFDFYKLPVNEPIITP